MKASTALSLRRLARAAALSALLVLAERPVFAVADILPPARRARTVDLARRLARPPEVPPLRATPPNPFAPPGFDQPDPEELKARASEAQAANTEAAKPASDAQVLARIADWLNPSGTFYWENEYILLVRQKKLKVGDHLTITFEGRDYDVEITAIDRTTYSLRMNRTEITRPINPGTSP